MNDDLRRFYFGMAVMTAFAAGVLVGIVLSTVRWTA